MVEPRYSSLNLTMTQLDLQLPSTECNVNVNPVAPKTAIASRWKGTTVYGVPESRLKRDPEKKGFALGQTPFLLGGLVFHSLFRLS